MKTILTRKTVLFLSLCIVGAYSRTCNAEELRVVEANGLTRAVKVLRGKPRVLVHLRDFDDSSGSHTCVASNVDGIVSDVTVDVTRDGVCVFESLKSGTWRISVVPSGGHEWVARIEELP